MGDRGRKSKSILKFKELLQYAVALFLSQGEDRDASSYQTSEATKTALNVIAGAAGEGTEEFIAEIAQGYLDKLTIQTDERNFWQMAEDGAYNAIVSGITSILFGTADIISGGNGKLPTAEDLESITTQAAEETASSIANETPKKQTNTDTAINDNHAEHTPAEQAVIERYKAASDASLRGFIEKVRGLVNNDYKNKIRHDINTETDRALAEAHNITGTDTNGYKQIIKGNAIQHIDKRHGSNGKADHSMANIDDFSRIGFVLDNFTNARVVPVDELDAETAKLSREWRNSDGTPAPLIAFSMPVNGTYYVVEAVPDSKAKVLAVVSAYISQKTNRSTLNQELSLAENQPGNLTSKTVPEILRTSTSNIPQAKNEVNGVAADKQFPLLYTERLLEQAKKNGNLYTQRLLQAQIEKAMQNSRSANADASTPMPTIYADYMREHNMLENYETSDGLNVDLENDANGDTIGEEDIVIGKSLGAKAKNYDIMDFETGEIYHFTEGTRIQNAEVFAGKGTNDEYRNAYKMARKYGGQISDWQHVKGFGWVSTPDGDGYAEVHWSQCEGIGKQEFFIKRWIDR